MSKNRLKSNVNQAKNELPRKITKSPATSGTGTTTKDRDRKQMLVKQQDSLEGKKTTKPATTTTTATASKKPSPSPLPSTSKIKERTRTTPSPGVPLRARGGKSTPEVVKTKPKAKTNVVMDNYHSVTVSSPPQKRRVQEKQTKEEKPKEPSPSPSPPPVPRSRTLTRTLQPEEVMVLKRSEPQVQESAPEIKQKPVAFEVNFASEKTKENESDNYSDDFESYESDFEASSGTPEDEEEEEDDNEEEQEEEEEQDDSELTQNPITVIQRDREQERKLDSGHFDLNMRRQPLLSSQSTLHSFDTNSMCNSEQLDSGISTTGLTSPNASGQFKVYYGGYRDFASQPASTSRGRELMQKLRMDQLAFQHFEMKPLSYEAYMQSYGKLNTSQTASQTQSQHMENECQTVEVNKCHSWTQHPPHYGKQMVITCSGDGGDEETTPPDSPRDLYEKSLFHLEQLHQREHQRSQEQQRQRLSKPTDWERLSSFLMRSSQLMAKVLNDTGSKTKPSRGSQSLQTGLLNALRVRRIFGNGGHMVVTVHECPPQSNVYSEDFANLLMVWSLNEPTKPLRLLSTWAEVCRVAFSQQAPDIIVAGLRDGSVAMWDLRETYSYCSKLDGHLNHFAATQSVVPSAMESPSWDLGAVVDVRSFRGRLSKDIQYASLNDSGLLTVWSLVESDASSATSNEYSSPWARVKLLQSACCNLRSYLEQRILRNQQSSFDKTKSLFQGNIYIDNLLKELNETQTLSSGEGLQGLRFTSIDAGSDLIYVCTNRNFVLCCTRSLKMERFSRISVNESRFLFPTSLCVLSNESFVAVGLSNGSVVILNCNQRHRPKTTTQLRRPPTSAINAAVDADIGKSCAIQNIILNEKRHSFDKEEEKEEMRPNTALELLQQPRRSYEMRIFDQQLLLSGNALREHLVQALVLSSDGWRLFALANGTVRVYDFYLDREVVDDQHQMGSHVKDITAGRSSQNDQYLLSLNQEGLVQIHSSSL
ncbi:uncharacterized protein Dwil_GK20629 [Drosophila willistoni]|uniref:WD repeat-containing protein 60 n=1 Tax=Drosophila willistoni TaxID=7260 RepID=B4MKD7_DROWI|nr:uncharacterized protein Dwil_GK20629 [Drosophila willistoni]